MTFTDVINEIRRITTDVVDERYRQSDPAMIELLNEAQRAIFQRRRDLFLSLTGDTITTMDQPTDATVVGDSTGINAQGKPLLIDYALARIYETDGPGGSARKSEEHLTRYMNALEAKV